MGIEKADNSLFFGKGKTNSLSENLEYLKNISSPNLHKNSIDRNAIGAMKNLEDVIQRPHESAEKQLNKQDEILEFLKNVTIEQSKTAEKQRKNNIWMTALALIFAFISIIPVLKELILPNETKTLYQNISELEQKLSSESERNLEMYKNLLDLENQVKNLEKEKLSILKK